ncbi:unnamed protein product [Discosporangium mesarthrocarpum]
MINAATPLVSPMVPYLAPRARSLTEGHTSSRTGGMNDDVIYTIDILTVFKYGNETAEDAPYSMPPETPPVPGVVDITTAGNGAMCGLAFNLHQEYLIGLMGPIPGGTKKLMRTSLCDVTRPWCTVTATEQALLRYNEAPCSAEYSPVCSTTEVTFSNRCLLENFACQDLNVGFAYEGSCLED